MTTTVIDDQDFTHVSYTGTWIKGGTPHELDGTVTSSTNPGDYFTVSFNGVSIAVYGTIDATSGGVVTDYSVDGASGQDMTSPAGSGDTYNQLFWQSPTFAAGNHSLKVTMGRVNDNSQSGPGEGTVWFDSFLVTDPTPSSTVQSPTSTSSSTVPGSNPPSSSTIQGSISSPSSIPGSNSPVGTTVPVQVSTSAIRKSHAGPIAGGVVASVVILLLAVLAFAFIRIRRRRNGAKVVVERTVHPGLILDGSSDKDAEP